MSISLPPLPFQKDALEPFISAETLDYHYGKHHKAYVDNLNKLIEGTPQAAKPLEEIVMSAEGGMFNNAAQAWNHAFYWQCLLRNPGGAPKGALADALSGAFGSVEKFKEEFAQAAATLFGSGWAWLVLDKGQLRIVQAPNAGVPMKSGQTALLTLDVWEHAYYIDYRNARPKYIEEALSNLINWDFVAGNLGKARG